MNLEIKTLCETDVEMVLAFEKAKLAQVDLPEMEKEMKSWSAPWRQEALEFYLPKGWSFGFFHPETEEFMGYFLAQPFCFFRGLTQTLWVEHLSVASEELIPQIVDVAYRTARTKHLQSVVAHKPDHYLPALTALNAEKLSEENYLLKTTRF